MKRKSVMYVGGLVLTLSVLLLIIALVLRYEPPFFREAEVAAGPERKRQAMEFLSACFQLGNGIRLDSRWQGKITTEQANSYLSENFESDVEKLVPPGVTDPRVTFDDGKIHLAFRYGSRPWSTVVSVDLRVWLVGKEYNVVALEVERIRAGLLPISGRSVLERLAEAIRSQNRGLEFNWYRHDGHPVALLRFQADRVVPTIRLQQLEVKPGELLIQGCAAEALVADDTTAK